MNKLRLVLLFCLFLSVIFLSTLIYVYRSWTQPQAGYGPDKIVHIKPGQSLKEVAALLYNQKIIKHPQIFILGAKLNGEAHKIQAGQFKLSPSWSLAKILDQLTKGSEVLYPLRIPEGLTWWQIGRLVEKNGFCSFDEFARSITERSFLDRMSIHAPSAEGFLFPETYFLSKSKNYSGQEIVGIFIQEFWQKTRDLWTGLSFNQIYQKLILASLVEKETARPEERKRIAGVFFNRLKKGMLLQCDPTVIYGLGPKFDGNLTKKHLQDKQNAYNTYTHKGLPPGPICSPGLASIKAALNPEKHNYLYFVAKGDGTHFFSSSLKEHNMAVYKYQIRRKR
ncbi:endolytic transglycosylase MltG [Desulfohalobiaceae bacterium Ax17]|uniref:endolytic transglycosylase MltG n=1 Tax=Desulfovulcanus ferrireducens TaxID=2831190 RepID=UPI00207BBB90|nr:endolytic transglycosylase MltG [Desulfovulcanus ferrireducens]MBT8762952.1 endolytic transglycosylase MltG [Desulfovulcanus ferrireducens]